MRRAELSRETRRGTGRPFTHGLARSFTQAFSVLADGKGVPGEAKRLA